MIVDFHAHAFPDKLAERAVPRLEAEGNISASLDGKIDSLISSMDLAGIDTSVVPSIATKPGQFESILKWNLAIYSERVVPFPSVHPEDSHLFDQIHKIKNAGFAGVKLHPYYQNFSLDEPRIVSLFERISGEGLILLLHTGFDLAFERFKICTPKMISQIAEILPGLKLVTTHFGAWQDWDEVEEFILGREIYLDTSYSIPFLGIERARKFLMRHPMDYILFGTDSPWADQKNELQYIDEMNLDEDRKRRLLGDNARRLLKIE